MPRLNPAERGRSVTPLHIGPGTFPESRTHFEFTAHVPGTFRMELIDEITLARYRGQGRRGIIDRAGGKILWIEPMSLAL